MRILAVSGSLRAASINTAVLEAAARLAPATASVVLFDGIGALPAFNPDLDGETVPGAVAVWRAAIGAADGLIISSPEYAHGIPGALKNALDWLVRSTEFPGKPVAILHAAQRSHHALAQLREVLTTMNARLVEDACTDLPLDGHRPDAQSVLLHAEAKSRLANVMTRFARAIGSP